MVVVVESPNFPRPAAGDNAREERPSLPPPDPFRAAASPKGAPIIIRVVMGITVIARRARHRQLHVDQDQREQGDLALIWATRTDAGPEA